MKLIRTVEQNKVKFGYYDHGYNELDHGYNIYTVITNELTIITNNYGRSMFVIKRVRLYNVCV